VMARNGSGRRMLRHTRLVLFCAVLALPSLTASQTIFDVSGSIPESNGTVATFSGTLTVSVQNNTVMGIESWDIQMPAIGSASTALPAFTFTPTNSSFYQYPEEGSEIGHFGLLATGLRPFTSVEMSSYAQAYCRMREKPPAERTNSSLELEIIHFDARIAGLDVLSCGGLSAKRVPSVAQEIRRTSKVASSRKFPAQKAVTCCMMAR
jgi:hypothetical protein